VACDADVAGCASAAGAGACDPGGNGATIPVMRSAMNRDNTAFWNSMPGFPRATSVAPAAAAPAVGGTVAKGGEDPIRTGASMKHAGVCKMWWAAACWRAAPTSETSAPAAELASSAAAVLVGTAARAGTWGAAPSPPGRPT